MSNLTDYNGEVMEILTSAEFEALQKETIHGIEDFHVCFSCDGDGEVQWNIERCFRCDPLVSRHGHHFPSTKLLFLDR